MMGQVCTSGLSGYWARQSGVRTSLSALEDQIHWQLLRGLKFNKFCEKLFKQGPKITLDETVKKLDLLMHGGRDNFKLEMAS